MRRYLGYIIILITVVAVAAVIVYGLTRPKPPEVPPETTATPTQPSNPQGAIPGDLSVKGFNVTKRDEQGNQVWSLQAGTEVKVNADSKQAEAKNVHWLLQQGSDTEWVVDAPQIVIDYETSRLVFTGGVKVKSADGSRRFSVPRLTYEPNSKKLIGEGGARFSQGGTVVTGERLVVDTKAHTVRLSGDMQAHIGK